MACLDPCGSLPNSSFQSGDKEKGFRDALVAESFLQLLTESPKTPTLCRVVLVTSDELLSQAVKERIADSPNASVLSNIEELKGLINTVVSNVGEDFIAQLKPKAARLFFVSADDKDTLYFKEKIGEQLRDKFKAQLETRPEGTVFRKDLTWHVNRPNFSRKDGRRIFWTSRIDVGMEAGIVITEDPVVSGRVSNPLTQWLAPGTQETVLSAVGKWDVSTARLQNLLLPNPSKKRVATHKGLDVFEVLWSTEVTMARELKKGTLQEIKHIESKWQSLP